MRTSNSLPTKTVPARLGKRLSLAALLASSILLGAYGASSAASLHRESWPSYKIRILGLLHRGFDAEAFAVNRKGRVAGYGSVVVKNGGRRIVTTHAFISHSRRIVDLGTPRGASASFAYGLNRHGLVAAAAKIGRQEQPYAVRLIHGQGKWMALPGHADGGLTQAVNSSGTVVGTLAGERATLWRSDARGFRLVALPLSNQSQALAIDDKGDVAGSSTAGSQPALLWPRGTSRLVLPGLGGLGSQADSVISTSRRTIVVAGGSHLRAGNERAVTWKVREVKGRWVAGTPQILGVLKGYQQSRAYSVNAKGWIVGISFDRTSYRAFLWKAGSMRSLDSMIHTTSHWRLTRGSAMNGRGQIAGWGNYRGQQRAFLMTHK